MGISKCANGLVVHLSKLSRYLGYLSLFMGTKKADVRFFPLLSCSLGFSSLFKKIKWITVFWKKFYYQIIPIQRFYPW